MPRQSSADDPTAAPTEEVPADDPGAAVGMETDAIPQGQRQMNEAMATEGTSRPDDTSNRSAYPPGSDELTAENVRRYPDLFTDEQIASIPNDELPETDIERQQREQAEAEAEAAS